ncbi:hypothetical protein C1646_769617 [Rhizophagus diaphanus]|nr:hypothetical protein C1646_769617 [Rhizophagus diaphanus] [Rhizophagus sp. MUCL 43196]
MSDSLGESAAPSADTLYSDVINKFNEERNNIWKILQNASGQLSFMLDAWTSPSYIPFLGIAIIAYTTDNASNNDTFIKVLEKTSAQDALSALKVRYVKNENELLNNDEVSEVVSKALDNIAIADRDL